MNNISNLIHKYDDFFLQDIGELRERSYITKPEDGDDLVAWDHRIDVALGLGHIVSYDFGTSLTESLSEQSSNFDNCLLQNYGLIWTILVTEQFGVLVLVFVSVLA